MMKFITRGGKGLEDKHEHRKATRREGMGLEEIASCALMRQGGGIGCCDQIAGVCGTVVKKVCGTVVKYCTVVQLIMWERSRA